MSYPTTLDPDTELGSVNSILGAIGQAPVSRLFEQDSNAELVFLNPEIAFIYQLLKEVDRDVQNEGWHFNTETLYPMPIDVNNEIVIPDNILRLDVSEGQVIRTTDVVRRNGKLYNKINHSYKFDKAIKADIVWLFDYEDLPSVFKRYITLRASGRAATQMVTNPQLVQLLGTQEGQARAAVMEYECNQSDSSYFGMPAGTMYRSYQPYRTLAR